MVAVPRGHRVVADPTRGFAAAGRMYRSSASAAHNSTALQPATLAVRPKRQYVALVSGRAFLLTAVVGLVLGAMCLALAAILNSSVLAVGGAAFVIAVLVAREGWLWAGEGRRWLITTAALAGVVVAAFAVQRLTG